MKNLLGAPAVLALYYLILTVLAFYGVHRLVVVVVYLRARRGGPVGVPDPAESAWVTVEVLRYNELDVGPRLVAAV